MEAYTKFMKAFYFVTLFLCSFTLFSQVRDHETMPFFSIEGYDSENSSQNIYAYVAQNIEYPVIAIDNCQSGTLWIQFTIDTIGNVIADSLLFENYPILIKQAKEFFYKTSGKWKPAIQGGKKVNSNISLPFEFNLRGGGCKAANDFFLDGLSAFEKEDYEKAAFNFRYALRRDPYNADYLYNTAVSYLKMYKIDSACYFASRIYSDKDLNTIRQKFCAEDTNEPINVETMPLFDGAKTDQETQEKIFTYVHEAAKKINTKDKGLVYVRFIVDVNGKAVKPEILKSENQNLNNFAIQIIKNMPEFIPGTQNGEPVKVQYNIPIRF